MWKFMSRMREVNKLIVGVHGRKEPRDIYSL
jgi:hypothetical protein